MSANSAAEFGFNTTTDEVAEGLDLTGKTYLITGATSGLGKETARVLGAHGAFVLAAGRTKDKAKAALDELGFDGSSSAAVACELSDLKSVKACVESVKELGRPLDGIIANAGIMALPAATQQLGIELQLFTNHVGHFALITQLLEQLATNGRVVVLSSMAHLRGPAAGIEFDNLDGERGYEPWKMYGQSKLANILFTKALASRLEGSGKTANCLHPGVIPTNLMRHLADAHGMLDRIGRKNLKTIPQGAATQTFLAVHPEAAQYNGQYFSDCQPAEPLPIAEDKALAERLWQWTTELVAPFGLY